MKVSVNWLRELAGVGSAGRAACARPHHGRARGGGGDARCGAFEKIVVARVMSVAPHPNADKLRVTEVDAGTGVALQIVCGAPNVAAGQKVPCALVGAKTARP